ncbi:MAG: MFS transporter [Candidatus Cloacimonadaceae bacterium]|jgi:UMF1 family MFS transporter|nr:MFS transporter [Candidatus Cloacimonadota bacterium]MCB5258831.1 MFS transporter [Candidatus Cloacimonadota bacterium]MDD5624763.1 MFS transporter [Candidatus Cloacimonadota bacterium]MDY0112353.1 MFS transporter [Candidatus Syntrophosphaera sp.]
MKLRKEAIGWMFYDFANSAFTTVIVTVVFSVYFVQTIASGSPAGGEWLWSRAITISMTLAAIFAPLLGAMADYSRSKKKFLFGFTILTILSTALLYFVRAGNIILAMILFIIANFSFNSANVFYDAFLPEIGMKKDIGRISGLGWGFGYIGGLVTLVLALALIDKRIEFVWPMVALHILIFSTITFLTLKEKQYPVPKKNYFKVALDRVLFSLKHIKKMPDLLNFLISYFLYNIGIYTVIVYAAIFGGAQFGMTQQSLILFFIIAQVTSFIGAVLFGLVADKLNVRVSLSISLMIWVVVVIWAFLCSSAQEYYYLGLLAGLAIGSSQANSRTMLSLLTPLDKQAEFFGFYTLMGRISSIIGPFVYGEITRISGNQRYAIISLIVFFVAGWIMLHQVKLERGIKFGQEYVFK